MATWCLLDTQSGQSGAIGNIDPATRVAGLSLIARHMRRAARQGWVGAVIIADKDARAQCQQALTREPPPTDFEVEYLAPVDSPPTGRSFVELSLHAVYDTEGLSAATTAGTRPEPVVAISDKADLVAAERLLYRSIRKSMDQDGVVAYYVFRAFSRLMTRLLIDTPVTPNQVSLTALALGVGAAVCAALGTVTGLVWAGGLFWFGAVVDCVDGEIARLRVKGSKLGEWLDSMADEVSTYGLLIGLGVGMTSMGYDSFWTLLAYIGSGVGAVLNIKLYLDLHRAGATIDTAQYPWFFGEPAAAPAAAGAWAQFVRWVGFCFRRDAFVTAASIMLVVDVPHCAVVLLAGGAFFMMGMLVVQLILMAGRDPFSTM